jgi:DNA-binding MarR family transcriptional regulator
MPDYLNTDNTMGAGQPATVGGPVTEQGGRTGMPASPGRHQAATERVTLPPSMRERVPFLLFRASQVSLSLANQMLADIGLCARQAGILTMVTELGAMTQKALAAALRIDRTTMVTLLDDLQAKGYVIRQRHPQDRRAFLVQPTDSGRAVKVAAVRILDQQQDRFLAGLNQAERNQLATLLKRLPQALPGPAGSKRARRSTADPVSDTAQPPLRSPSAHIWPEQAVCPTRSPDNAPPREPRITVYAARVTSVLCRACVTEALSPKTRRWFRASADLDRDADE